MLPVEPSFSNAYGLTETHGVATLNGGKDLLGKKTSAGRPFPFLDMKIIDESGKDARRRPAGRALDLRPHHHARLLEPPRRHGRSRARTAGCTPGDLGYRDREGFYFVVDRAKDMILRGGENVYCIEIENCLADHPEIDEAAVVGVPDVELGEKVKAIVRRVPGAKLDEAGVQRHVGAHLARFKVPEIVEFTDQPLPRNAAGKLLKNQLRGTAS